MRETYKKRTEWRGDAKADERSKHVALKQVRRGGVPASQRSRSSAVAVFFSSSGVTRQMRQHLTRRLHRCPANQQQSSPVDEQQSAQDTRTPRHRRLFCVPSRAHTGSATYTSVCVCFLELSAAAAIGLSLFDKVVRECEPTVLLHEKERASSATADSRAFEGAGWSGGRG